MFRQVGCHGEGVLGCEGCQPNIIRVAPLHNVIRVARLDPLSLQAEFIRRAENSAAPAIEHMGVDHGRADIAVAEKLLNGANVVSVFHEMCRERMPKGVAARGFGDSRLEAGVSEGPLQHGLVKVMTPDCACLSIGVVA